VILLYTFFCKEVLLSSRRTFGGQVHVRLSPEAHEDIAKEAFEKGTSISGIVAQSLMLRRALKNLDPWKAITEIREANRGVDKAQLEKDIADAIKAVRKKARGD
jgi:predicted DNA-binding helix-hairpin-helix protein